MDDDIFHDVVMSEERSLAAGHETGVQEGRARGIPAGYRLGIEKGKAVGFEMGFYHGFVHRLQRHSGFDSKPRVKRLLDALSDMVEKFPITDPQNASFFEELEAIRSKFRQLTSLLGVKVKTKHPEGVSF